MSAKTERQTNLRAYRLTRRIDKVILLASVVDLLRLWLRD